MSYFVILKHLPISSGHYGVKRKLYEIFDADKYWSEQDFCEEDSGKAEIIPQIPGFGNLTFARHRQERKENLGKEQ
ncbi:hypothetical protein HNY73_008510 [Argiope bruennichi]|uniref:Uncharacterized protein n=1 Tax=Argiope bruennichi TaxID=94029 RepID=A0A8T0F7N3_ARGBR|nr:hypothetical protein HNY73_008510 [Argiope bruennichi]